MKISVPNFQKHRVITCRFRKILDSILNSHVLLHWIHLSLARNARGYANVGTEILCPLACNFSLIFPISTFLDCLLYQF